LVAKVRGVGSQASLLLQRFPRCCRAELAPLFLVMSHDRRCSRASSALRQHRTIDAVAEQARLYKSADALMRPNKSAGIGVGATLVAKVRGVGSQASLLQRFPRCCRAELAPLFLVTSHDRRSVAEQARLYKSADALMRPNKSAGIGVGATLVAKVRGVGSQASLLLQRSRAVVERSLLRCFWSCRTTDAVAEQARLYDSIARSTL